MPLVFLSGVALAKTDKMFISDAIKGDNSEVILGQIAAEKGANEGIRSFGNTLETEDAKAKKQALAVAKKLGVTPPTGMTDEAKAEREKLRDLSGEAFDREFASYMVKDHEKDIAEFKEKAASGDSRVSRMAKMQIPALEKHLKIAQGLSK